MPLILTDSSFLGASFLALTAALSGAVFLSTGFLAAVEVAGLTSTFWVEGFSTAVFFSATEALSAGASAFRLDGAVVGAGFLSVAPFFRAVAVSFFAAAAGTVAPFPVEASALTGAGLTGWVCTFLASGLFAPTLAVVGGALPAGTEAFVTGAGAGALAVPEVGGLATAGTTLAGAGLSADFFTAEGAAAFFGSEVAGAFFACPYKSVRVTIVTLFFSNLMDFRIF